jgi:hypothetical protein
MHMRVTPLALVALVTLLPLAAAAEEAAAPAAEAGVKPAITVGAFELVGLSPDTAHLGVYVALSLDVLVPLDADWMIIPSFGFEFCPEFGNWGGTFYLIADRFLTQLGSTTLTVQGKVGLLHDALPGADGFEHDLYLSFGAGTAIITAHGTWLPSVTANVGLAGQGWSLSPTLLFSVPF